MQIHWIIEEASEESQRIDRGIILWSNEFGDVETGPDFPWERASDLHLMCVVYGGSILWARRM